MNNAWIAALALGALAVMPKDPGHNLMKLPSFRGVAEVRASIPGRMRLYMPAIASDPERAANMREQLGFDRSGAFGRIAAHHRLGAGAL